MNHPNILYIHTHDCGRYVQPYGFDVPTPNIQQFAEEGLLFRQMYCAAPTCSPSRAAMLTGLSAHSSGMTGLAHCGFSLHDHSRHIVSTLKNAGYHTALSGIQHEADPASLTGYDEILDDSVHGDESSADCAAEFLTNPPDRPFFLSVGFFVTHRDFPEPGDQEDERYVMPPPIFPDTLETRRDFACYQAAARKLDDYMGRVFDALKKSSVADNTVVICTADHGIAFPKMKCELRDHGIGVMFIMKGPGIEPGRVSDALLSQVDVFPTLCDMIGIDRPDWLQGQSFLPLVRDENDEGNEEIFAEVSFHCSYEPQRCVRTDRWKYIRRFDDTDFPHMPNCDESITKSLWMQHGWREQHIPREELFDLMFDPQEMRSVADLPENAETLGDLRVRLSEWMQRTNDPLLDGPMEPPDGAYMADPEGLTPEDTMKQYHRTR
jgi:N-sulfoglucosamine sulfohydrolase